MVLHFKLGRRIMKLGMLVDLDERITFCICTRSLKSTVQPVFPVKVARNSLFSLLFLLLKINFRIFCFLFYYYFNLILPNTNKNVQKLIFNNENSGRNWLFPTPLTGNTGSTVDFRDLVHIQNVILISKSTSMQNFITLQSSLKCTVKGADFGVPLL